LTVHNCTFYNNVADYNGGAICVKQSGFVSVTNSTFANNSAPYESFWIGGGGGGDNDSIPGGGGGGGGNPNLVTRGYGGAIYVHPYCGTGST